MKGYKHTTEEQRTQVLEVYRRTRHTRPACEETGLSYSSVLKVLRDAGEKPRGGRVGACHRNHATVERMAREGASMKEIAETVGTNTETVSRYLREHRLERPHYRQHPGGMARYHKGKHHPRWKGGRTIDKNGYVLVHCPDHPRARTTGYVLEHRLAMERQLGRLLEDTEVVHHIDGNRSNNDPSNLEVFASNADHLRHELTGVPCPARGRKRMPTRTP